jgi:pimeloyl-ACP methyl ester carboxylesterase
VARLVLFHGFAASNFTWRSVLGPLSAHHEAVAIERPFVPVADAVDATISALDDRGWRDAVLIGHSAGAELAARVAAADPTRCRGMVLVAPVVGGGPPAIARAVARAPVVRNVAPSLLRLGVRVGLDRALKQTWADKSAVTPDVVAGYRAPLLAPGVAESLWAMTAAAAATPVDWGRLTTIPTLVVIGDRDKWAAAPPLPDATVLTYETCGHLPHEEQPTRFVDDILGFLAAL